MYKIYVENTVKKYRSRMGNVKQVLLEYWYWKIQRHPALVMNQAVLVFSKKLF